MEPKIIYRRRVEFGWTDNLWNVIASVVKDPPEIPLIKTAVEAKKDRSTDSRLPASRSAHTFQ